MNKPRTRSRRISFSRTVLQVVLTVCALVYLYPVFLIMFSALKTGKELTFNPIGVPHRIVLDHFVLAFQRMHYIRSMFNSVLITAVSLFLVIVLASAASYAISRKNTRLYNVVYVLFMAGLIIPFQMTMIPLYGVMRVLHLINTYRGIILIYVAITGPFAVFLYTRFMKTIPNELAESAIMDGCRPLVLHFRVVFPLLKAVTSTVIVLISFWIWNDFLQPLLFLQSMKMRTIVVQIFNFVGQYSSDWPPIFAGILLALYPVAILYAFAQKSIIGGLTSGSLKG